METVGRIFRDANLNELTMKVDDDFLVIDVDGNEFNISKIEIDSFADEITQLGCMVADK